MEIYPELNLQPTSVYNWQKPLLTGYVCLSLMLWSIACLTIKLYDMITNDYDDDQYFGAVCAFIFMSSVFLIGLYMFIANKRKISKLNDVSLQDIADYIQKYTLLAFSKESQYVFFVKNNKMGILDVQSQHVVIPAEYDMLTWKTKNNILQAKIHGSAFLIDINNKKLS